jgi:hypothetical protein
MTKKTKLRYESPFPSAKEDAAHVLHDESSAQTQTVLSFSL